MDCSTRIFVLHEKHADRYVIAKNKELTARAIVRARINEGYWYDSELTKKLAAKLDADLPVGEKTFYKWLLARKVEYETVSEHYLEDLV